MLTKSVTDLPDLWLGIKSKSIGIPFERENVVLQNNPSWQAKKWVCTF
jgi:hypothetical protein